jgi:hypothetical protein
MLESIISLIGQTNLTEITVPVIATISSILAVAAGVWWLGRQFLAINTKIDTEFKTVGKDIQEIKLTAAEQRAIYVTQETCSREASEITSLRERVVRLEAVMYGPEPPPTNTGKMKRIS